jgi:hypothetical protein
MIEHGGMGRPKWHCCCPDKWRLGTLALHHLFAVLAAALGADFEAPKIQLGLSEETFWNFDACLP